MWTLSGFADEIDDDLETQCSLLDQLGIRFIEFRAAWGVNVLDLDDEQVARARDILSAHGIQASSIGSPIGKVNITDDFDAHLARMDRAVWVAQQLRAPFIRVFSFFLTADQRPEDHRDEVVRRMAALAQRAEAGGVVLLHENEKGIFGDVPERVFDLVTAVNSPALRLAWDAANYVHHRRRDRPPPRPAGRHPGRRPRRRPCHHGSGGRFRQRRRLEPRPRQGRRHARLRRRRVDRDAVRRDLQRRRRACRGGHGHDPHHDRHPQRGRSRLVVITVSSSGGWVVQVRAVQGGGVRRSGGIIDRRQRCNVRAWAG